MTCYSPITAFKMVGQKTINNKALIVFKNPGPGSRAYEKLEIPCGQCIGCRIDKAKQWSIRCVHEASMFQNNCFITLTFDEENINQSGSLQKSDFQKFMKRLRKRYSGIEEIDGKYPIRYFHCGEYGSQLDRPHHHACIFNFDFPDKQLYTVRNKIRLYRSESLEELWPFGFSTIGDVTIESAAYCARYITKKVTGKKAKEHYKNISSKTGEITSIIPEYNSSSRRPGIGKTWFNKYHEDIYSKDFFTIAGRKFRSPLYYDKLYESKNAEDLKILKYKRRIKRFKRKECNTLAKLKVKRIVKESKLKNLVRSFENGNNNV